MKKLIRILNEKIIDADNASNILHEKLNKFKISSVNAQWKSIKDAGSKAYQCAEYLRNYLNK